jgi:hypothetical protein
MSLIYRGRMVGLDKDDDDDCFMNGIVGNTIRSCLSTMRKMRQATEMVAHPYVQPRKTYHPHYH